MLTILKKNIRKFQKNLKKSQAFKFTIARKPPKSSKKNKKSQKSSQNLNPLNLLLLGSPPKSSKKLKKKSKKKLKQKKLKTNENMSGFIDCLMKIIILLMQKFVLTLFHSVL